MNDKNATKQTCFKEKDGFMLYYSQYDSIYDLSIEEKAALLDAIYLSHKDGVYNPSYKIDLNKNLDRIFRGSFKQRFGNDEKKYLERCQKNKDSINQRWHPKEEVFTDTNEFN